MDIPHKAFDYSKPEVPCKTCNVPPTLRVTLEFQGVEHLMYVCRKCKDSTGPHFTESEASYYWRNEAKIKHESNNLR